MIPRSAGASAFFERGYDLSLGQVRQFMSTTCVSRVGSYPTSAFHPNQTLAKQLSYFTSIVLRLVDAVPSCLEASIHRFR
jgi:hypothetical protein